MSEDLIGAHNGSHSEQGSMAGEHPGRSANPIIKVHDVLWLEFEKPDLVKAEAFAHSFGFEALAPWMKLHPNVDVTCVVDRDKPGRALLHHVTDAQLVGMIKRWIKEALR